MRILLVFKLFTPHKGGIESLLYNVAKGLGEQGHQVTVLTNRKPHATEDTPLFEHAGRNVQVIRLPTLWLPKNVDATPCLSKVFSTISRQDVIHVFGSLHSSLFLIALIFGKMRRKHIVWQPIYYFGAASSYGRSFSTFLGNKRKMASIKFYLKFCSAILALTDEEKAFFRSINSMQAYSIGEAVEMPPNVPFGEVHEVLRRFNLSAGKYVLSVGRVTWYKGHDLLIRAWKNIEEKYPDVKLVVVGRDWGYKSKLTLLTRQNRLDSVVFLGEVQSCDLNALYEGSLVVALTTRSEAFHRIALEAWSHKKPIVALDLGAATKHILPSNGVLVQKEDEAEVEAAIVKLLSDPEGAASLGKNGYETFRENYTLTVYARRLTNIYRQIVKMQTQVSGQEFP
jgi:glycosyltransferase involved in cell wall biosynthesis